MDSLARELRTVEVAVIRVRFRITPDGDFDSLGSFIRSDHSASRFVRVPGISRCLLVTGLCFRRQKAREILRLSSLLM